MNRICAASLVVGGFALSGCASVPPSITPLPDASQQVRYELGVGTTYSEKANGIVEVMPLRYGDDHVAFKVAAYNKGSTPANFGPENITIIEDDGTSGRVMTVEEIEHEMKVEAAWAEAGTILAGGIAGGLSTYAASQNAYSTTHTTLRTPYGNASVTTRSYDPTPAYEASREAGEMTGAGIASIQRSLSRSLAGAQQTALQTTTLGPGDSYGGVAVTQTLHSSKLPQSVSLEVNWNGEDHLFRYTIGDRSAVPPPSSAAKADDARPAPANLMPEPSSPPTNLTLQAGLPLGHVSKAEKESASINASEPAAPVSYSDWRQGTAHGKPRPKRAISITGAVN